MKFNKWTLGLAAIAAIALAVCGCKTKLEPGGAYAPGVSQIVTNVDGTVSTNFTATAAPDIAFYYADAAYNTAYAMADGVFKWEMQNEKALWKLNPKIKHTLDDLRPKVWAIHVQWAKARQAYLANPIPANLNIYQRIVAQIQSLAAAASSVETLSLTQTATSTN
jgi:hypothetical protein